MFKLGQVFEERVYTTWRETIPNLLKVRINHFDADWYKVRIVVERSIFSLALRVVLTRMTVRTELGVRGRQVVDDILSKGCCF